MDIENQKGLQFLKIEIGLFFFQNCVVVDIFVHYLKNYYFPI